MLVVILFTSLSDVEPSEVFLLEREFPVLPSIATEMKEHSLSLQRSTLQQMFFSCPKVVLEGMATWNAARS